MQACMHASYYEPRMGLACIWMTVSKLGVEAVMPRHVKGLMIRIHLGHKHRFGAR